MCRSCDETPDGQGRRCGRPDGFVEAEADRRNRARNLSNAQNHLSAGNAQAAANSLARAAAAHRGAVGAAAGGPVQPPAEATGPFRDFAVSPSDAPTAVARIEMHNQERAKVGLPPLQVDVSRSYQDDPEDPIYAMESTTIRVHGAATQEELDRISVGSVRDDPERKVKASAVMEAAVVAHRLNNKVYVARGEGPNSVPDQVNRYIAEGPNGPLRQRLAPTQADKDEAGRVRIWVRSQQPTSDYQAALRHALNSEYMSPREAGTAASALSPFTRYQQRLEEARQAALAKRAQAPHGEGPAVYSPTASGSRWLGQKDQKVSVTARVEVAHPVRNEHSRFPRMLYIMRTPQGDLVRWFASEDQGMEPGDAVTLQGTVKDHSVANGERQTELWYCKAPAIHPPVRQPL